MAYNLYGEAYRYDCMISSCGLVSDSFTAGRMMPTLLHLGTLAWGSQGCYIRHNNERADKQHGVTRTASLNSIIPDNDIQRSRQASGRHLQRS